MTLIGNGPQYAEVVAALAHMPNCRVRALGWLSRSEVIGELSRNSDFLLLPSQAGGRPHVVLEALATATAPIISDIPAHRALLQIEHDSDPALRWLWPPGACERAVELIAGLWENVAKEKAFWRDYSRVALDTQNVFAEGVRIMTAGFGAWPATPTLTAARLGPAATIEYSNPHHAI